MMNWQKTKRHYSDFRIGLPIIAPILSISNFILLAYNFTALKDIIPLEIFGVMFAIVFVVSMISIGKVFRKKQQPTEFNLIFERSQNQARMFRLILECVNHENLNYSHYKEIQETIEYLKKIESGTI